MTARIHIADTGMPKTACGMTITFRTLTTKTPSIEVISRLCPRCVKAQPDRCRVMTAVSWRIEPEFWSATATAAEHAFVGKYELVAFDLPPRGPTPRIIGWELYTGRRHLDLVDRGDADSFECAKEAAEAALRSVTS